MVKNPFTRRVEAVIVTISAVFPGFRLFFSPLYFIFYLLNPLLFSLTHPRASHQCSSEFPSRAGRQHSDKFPFLRLVITACTSCGPKRPVQVCASEVLRAPSWSTFTVVQMSSPSLPTRGFLSQPSALQCSDPWSPCWLVFCFWDLLSWFVNLDRVT